MSLWEFAGGIWLLGSVTLYGFGALTCGGFDDRPQAAAWAVLALLWPPWAALCLASWLSDLYAINFRRPPRS